MYDSSKMARSEMPDVSIKSSEVEVISWENDLEADIVLRVE
jgi:hypothetical protein